MNDEKKDPTLTAQDEVVVAKDPTEGPIPAKNATAEGSPTEEATVSDGESDQSESEDAVIEQELEEKKTKKKLEKLNKPQKQSVNFKNLPNIIGRIAFLLVALFLVAYTITVITGSDELIGDFSERTAFIEFEDNIQGAESLARVHYDNLYAIADRLQYADSREVVEQIMSDCIGAEEFGDLRYYTQGNAYTYNGTLVEFEVSGAEMISELATSKKSGCTAVYYDQTVEKDCIAFFIPIRGSAYVDGLLSIVPARHIIETTSLLPETATSTMVLDLTGRVLDDTCAEDFPYTVGNNFYSFIEKMTSDHSQTKALEQMLRGGQKDVCTVNLANGSYTICVCPLDAFDGQILLLTMSPAEGLVSPEMTYIRHVINISVIAIAVLLVGGGYALFYYRKNKGTLDVAGATDAELGCPNGDQFRTSAGRLLQNKEYQYAVAILDIRQFQYLSERLSSKDMTEFLKFVAKVIETFCKVRETYGYLGEGKFGMVMIYANDRSVRERVRLIETVVNKNSILGASRAKKKFNIGISLTQEFRRQSIREMLNHATIACEKAKNDVKLPYVIYTEEIGTERINNERIEAEMEAALANGEFRLFLQPKYNITGDRIDSAEALVRWFDAKRGDYRFPGEFIGLFESNGFITELDHFMYIETLRYLSNAAARNEKVVPISVNVSMVTVSNPNFLEFYVKNKKNYGIGDGFIIIEFTESFAMEDYQQIRTIVDTLHRNGILCSLDDFGTGYSSLGTLKHIPFDELKFDRMFLKEGHNKKNDDSMMEALFVLAKSLGIRVVQEGVETKEMFDRMVALGCDVIQGYYYAKAIPVEEFKLFVGSNTSIKYKSRVK